MNFKPTMHKLSNGITVLLDHSAARATYVMLDLGFGSRIEKESEFGIVHFVEHMLLKGTVNRPERDGLREYISAHSGGINAATSYDFMMLDGCIVSENINILLDLFADQLKNSLFDEDTVENEKKVILDELRRSNDDKRNTIIKFAFENLLPNTGMQHDTLGTESTIKSFSAKQLKDFLYNHLSANNIFIGISGNVPNPDDVLQKLESLFGWIQKKELPNMQYNMNSGVFHKVMPTLENVSVKIYVQSIIPFSFDNRYQRWCENVFKSVLKKRLYYVLRNKFGLVYSVSVNSLVINDVRVNVISTETAFENVSELVRLIAETCADILRDYPITAAEFDRCIAMDKLEDARSYETGEERCDEIMGFYRDHKKVQDLEKDMAEFYKMPLEDVLKYSAKFFANPVSIITCGQDAPKDIKQIWLDNFK